MNENYLSTYVCPIAFVESLSQEGCVCKRDGNNIEATLDNILNEWQEIIIQYWENASLGKKQDNIADIRKYSIFNFIEIDVICEFVKDIYEATLEIRVSTIVDKLISIIATWEDMLFEEWEANHFNKPHPFIQSIY